MHFFILSFNGQLDSTFFRSYLVTFDGVVTRKYTVIPLFRTLHYYECKQEKRYLPIMARVYWWHFKMVDIRYIMMCYVNDIFRFTFLSTLLWWVPGSPSGWWRLRKAKRLLLGGQKVFKNCATKFPLGCNDFISLQQDCQQVAKKLRILTLNTPSCYMVPLELC